MSLRTTPFHARTGPLSEGQAWRRWAGYVVASSYELSHEREYHAIRNAARPFDVVHAHVASFLPFAPMLEGLPVVYTLHHDRDERLSRFYRQQAKGTRYVAISARQARLHEELRPTVVHHGLAPERYRFGARGQGYLAFLGRLSEVKGPDVAIEVAGRLGAELRMGGNVHEIDGDFFGRVLAPMLRLPHVRGLWSGYKDRWWPSGARNGSA